jgi:hypothetical protein
VSGPDRLFRKWASRRRGPSAEELIARAERLANTPRPPDGYPPEWFVEAEHLGDLNAIAIASIRAEMQYPRSVRSTPE